MPVQPIQISIDSERLRRIDADPETKKRGRSAFIRSAIDLYLKVRDRKEIEAKLARAYRNQATDLSAETSGLIEAQSWPDE
jgi:metal-responsive CopG/Arc/MetJ family transcriptional regulator